MKHLDSRALESTILGTASVKISSLEARGWTVEYNRGQATSQGLF